MGDLNSLKSALIEFEKESEVEFQLSDITEDFISRVKEYLLTNRELSSNTTQKRLNSFRVFVNYCEDKKYI
jgi:site-specific recombinase XerD